jgi:hypothetical protein
MLLFDPMTRRAEQDQDQDEDDLDMKNRLAVAPAVCVFSVAAHEIPNLVETMPQVQSLSLTIEPGDTSALVAQLWQLANLKDLEVRVQLITHPKQLAWLGDVPRMQKLHVELSGCYDSTLSKQRRRFNNYPMTNEDIARWIGNADEVVIDMNGAGHSLVAPSDHVKIIN